MPHNKFIENPNHSMEELDKIMQQNKEYFCGSSYITFIAIGTKLGNTSEDQNKNMNLILQSRKNGEPINNSKLSPGFVTGHLMSVIFDTEHNMDAIISHRPGNKFPVIIGSASVSYYKKDIEKSLNSYSTITPYYAFSMGLPLLELALEYSSNDNDSIQDINQNLIKYSQEPLGFHTAGSEVGNSLNCCEAQMKILLNQNMKKQYNPIGTLQEIFKAVVNAVAYIDPKEALDMERQFDNIKVLNKNIFEYSTESYLDFVRYERLQQTETNSFKPK